MVHVYRLGPFKVGKRDAFAYGGIDDAGAIIRPEVAHTDEEGLAAIAKRHPGPLRCEPALATAGAALGFEPSPLPEDALFPRAVLTYGLAVGGTSIGAPPLDLLFRFFEACAAYWEATPWGLLGSDDPIPVVLETGRGRRDAEASVLGAGGEEFGLALYDEPGAIARVASAASRGRNDEATRFACTSVTFDAEPAWAVEVFETAFDLPRLPVALRIRKQGKVTPAGADELRTLTAALEAMVAMLASDDLDPGVAMVDAGGLAVTAHVSFPDNLYDDLEEEDPDLADPMPVPEPLTPARRAERVPRNAPCPCGSGRKYKKCHLAQDEERERAARGTGPAAEVAREQSRRLAERDPIHALSERITADALALARRRLGKDFAPERTLKDVGLDFEASQMLLGWCSDHYRGPTGETALDLYLAERGGALGDEGRRLTAALRQAWFSYHEVIAAEPGVSITLRDMLAGSEQVVQECTASRTVRPRDVLLARVLDLGDRAILAGCHPRSLPPREGDLACRFARKALRTRAKAIPPAKLRSLTADGTLLLGWQELVRAIDA